MQKGVIIVIGLGILILILLGVFFFVPPPKEEMSSVLTSSSTMKLTSPAFEHNGTIPKKYTCDGENINPELQITGVPENAKSLVLIMDDPDAPGGTFVHWVVFNIDPKTTVIEEKSNPPGSYEGMTGFRRAGYGGPCPPSGTHRYFFKAYALDIGAVPFTTHDEENRETLLKLIKNHILAQAELVGLYAR